MPTRDWPQGLHIYRNHNESSKLYRIVLTARKNTIMDDYGMSWHLGTSSQATFILPRYIQPQFLVAYLDRSPFAAELPTIHSIRRFARCAALMPYGYFIPEFGRLAAEPPPPMKRVNWKTIAFSLPPIQSQQNECGCVSSRFAPGRAHLSSRDPRHASGIRH